MTDPLAEDFYVELFDRPWMIRELIRSLDDFSYGILIQMPTENHENTVQLSPPYFELAAVGLISKVPKYLIIRSEFVSQFELNGCALLLIGRWWVGHCCSTVNQLRVQNTPVLVISKEHGNPRFQTLYGSLLIQICMQMLPTIFIRAAQVWG